MKTLPRFGVEIHEGHLSDGAKVVLFKRKGMPISMDAVFFAGSRFDSTSGTAHFLEHMLVAGTERFPTKNQISKHVEIVGGDFGASTNSNMLRLSVEIPEARDIQYGTDILNEMLTKSLFDPATIEKERGAILSEFNSKKSHPKEFINEVSRRLSLQGTSSGKSVIGNQESIREISREQLLDHKKKFITSGRAAYVASGDIEINALTSELEKITLPKESRFETEGRLPVIREKKLDVEHYPGANELQVAISTRTDVADYKEYCSLMVLCSILGGGRGSRLITRLRYESGLVYSISSYVFDNPDWGNLVIRFSCGKNDLEKVKELIFGEFKNLRNISEKEVSEAQNKISKSFIREHQTSRSWVDFHENQILFNPDHYKDAGDYAETVASLSPEDIRFVIDKYLKEENFLTAICGDY